MNARFMAPSAAASMLILAHLTSAQAPPRDTPPSEPAAQGTVRRLLHGPKGEVRGVLLQDGRSGRFEPKEAAQLTPLWQPGIALILRGDALTTEHGTVIAIREIGTSRSDMRRLEGRPKPKKPKTQGHPGEAGTSAVQGF